MKYITFAFIVFALISTCISKTVHGSNEEDKKKADDYANNLVDEMNFNLTKISNGLRADKRYLEMANVEATKYMVVKDTRPTLLITNNYLFKYPQYWRKKSLDLESTTELTNYDPEEVLTYLKQLCDIIDKISNGLRKDNKTKEATIVSLYKWAINQEVIPIVKANYRLVKQYENYLKPSVVLIIGQELDGSNDEDAKKADDYVLEMITAMTKNLTTIYAGLNRDHKYVDIGKVTYTKFMLIRDSKPTLLNSNKYLFKYPQYWRNQTIDLDLPDQKTVSAQLDELINILEKINRGLTKDHETKDAIMVALYKWAIVNEVVPVVKSYYNLLDTYKEYLKPNELTNEIYELY